jgi:magnesium transporter
MINLYYEQNAKIVFIDNLDMIKSLITLNEKPCFVTVINPTHVENDILSQLFKLHIVTIKNIITKKQIPKVENYDNYLSTIIYDTENASSESSCCTNPVSIILMEKITLILAKKDFVAMEEIHSRFLSNPRNAFTSASSLYYIAIDVLTDNLFPILANVQKGLDKLQENILQNKAKDNSEKIILLRKYLLKLERIFSFEEDVLYKLSHGNMNFISEDQIPYIKDIYHHLEKLNATLKEYDGWASTLNDAYIANSSSIVEDKLNLLTIIAFIVMPIDTLTGWYGMSFVNIPELNFKYGYFCLIGVVVIYLISIIMYFKKKKMLR